MNKLNKLLYLLGIMLTLISTAQAAWEDATTVAVKEQSKQALDRVNKVLFSYVSVANISSSVLVNSTRLVIKNPSIMVLNEDGVTEEGDAYLNLNTKDLAPGVPIKVRVDFMMTRAALSFDASVETEAQENIDLKLLSHEFVELRGRAGHKGLFPLFSAPNAGENKLHTVISKDVKKLLITIMTDFGNSDFVAVVGESLNEDEKQAYTDIVLPSTPFKLRFEMVSGDGSVKIIESESLVPRTFSIALVLAEGHSFSAGDNSVVLFITNHSDIDDTYDVKINASENYLGSPLVSTKINAPAGKRVKLPVSIVVPKTTNIHTLRVTAQVKETSALIFEKALIEILVLDEPLILSKVDSQIVINPGLCEPLDKSQDTVNITLSGSSHLDVNNIDITTLKIIGDDTKPIDFELVDISTTADKSCEQQEPDGIIDLLLTFDLQEILEKNNDAESREVYLTLIYFTKNKMRYSHGGLLIFP